MATANAWVTVDTTRRLLSAVEADNVGGQRLALNNEGTVDVRLGGATVAAGDGFLLAAGAALTWYLDPGEVLHGIAASGSSVVSVLRGGV